MLEIVLTSSESDQYSSAPKEMSKLPLMYTTGYFCRSVYIGVAVSFTKQRTAIPICKTDAGRRQTHKGGYSLSLFTDSYGSIKLKL